MLYLPSLSMLSFRASMLSLASSWRRAGDFCSAIVACVRPRRLFSDVSDFRATCLFMYHMLFVSCARLFSSLRVLLLHPPTTSKAMPTISVPNSESELRLVLYASPMRPGWTRFLGRQARCHRIRRGCRSTSSCFDSLLWFSVPRRSRE